MSDDPSVLGGAYRVGGNLCPLRTERGQAPCYLDLAGVIFVALDRDGRITLLNRAGGELLGVSPGEVIGEIWFDRFLPEPMRDGVWRVFRRLMDTGEEPEVATYENPVLTAAGTEKIVLWHNAIIRDEAGNTTGTLSSGQDITERLEREAQQQKLEQRILQAQKTESLAMLAGGVAHDFNNLLASIMGNASLALLDLAPTSPARESVEDIELAASRAADLAMQMLAYAGKGQFVLACVDCSELIEEMSHLLHTAISRKIVLRLDLARHLPPVSVDVAQLRQVIMNLLSNAADAIGDRSGVVSITTGVSEIAQEYLHEIAFMEDLRPGMFISIEVTDTGDGMDADTQSKIFDPFFSTKLAGRGLGLAAVQGIVRTHGGAIGVYSEPGQGTTLKVLLPVADEALEILDPADNKHLSWHPTGTVLLVDDDENLRTTTRRMLLRMGFEVLTASDGKEAIEIFDQHADEIRVVILDLIMPHLNGEEAFGVMKRRRPDVRVVLSSGYNEQHVTQRFAGRGIAGFIQKPYQYHSLVEALKSALQPPGET